MGLIRTYLDAGVLIAAARSATRLSESALVILDDTGREFVASDYLKLEILPKAYYIAHWLRLPFMRSSLYQRQRWFRLMPLTSN
jgi:hypothetical protein